MAILLSVLMNILQYTASEPPDNIIWVWNAVRCAFGSSTPVNDAFTPTRLGGTMVPMISGENGMGNALGGDGCLDVLSSTTCSLCACSVLLNSSLTRFSSSFLLYDAANSA